MKTEILAAMAALVLAAGCTKPSSQATASSNHWQVPELLLTAHAGTNAIDLKIRQCQTSLRKADLRSGPVLLTELGWLFVSKARLSSNPSFYSLADRCGQRLSEHDSDNLEALLLRGHASQNMHRFAAAEVLARELIARRGASFDHGLLGDALMEQGRLLEAIEAYQRMVDLRPDVHAYGRIAQIRWLKGQLTGAVEAMRLAVAASSPADPEAAAWVQTGLARYLFQANETNQALALCNHLLTAQPEHAPALLLRGRLELAAQEYPSAVLSLRSAALLDPSPEYLWVLLEALQVAGLSEEADEVEARLRRQGPHTDPRTFALFLATRGEAHALALKLAQAELETRQDIFTQDALAWALAANGQWSQARHALTLALAEGTQDARLFLHATIISLRAGQTEEAMAWQTKLQPLVHTLLPSELSLLPEPPALALR